MVEALRETFSKKYNLEKRNLSFLKLYHAGDTPGSKILFFVFYSGKTLGVVKIIRDAKHNEKLEDECNAQSNVLRVMKGDMLVPEVLHSGFVGKHFFMYETCVPGVPVGKKFAKKYITTITEYQLQVIKKQKVAISNIYKIFSSVPVQNKKYQELVNKLLENSKSIFCGDNHGDMTFMNILVNKNDLYIIDWENFGERSVWGLDFVHYFVRAHNNVSIEILLEHFDELKEKPMNSDEFESLCAIDSLYDFLEKNNQALYKDVCKEILELC